MQLYDTVLKMRELLLDRGVKLTPTAADAHEQYEGGGGGAEQAWQAFRTVATEPAYDAVKAPWGDTVAVNNGGLMFEAGYSPGWPESPHNERDREVPEHYELDITRQFELGDAGDLLGLRFTIFVRADDELRTLGASLFGGEGDAADIDAWLDEVEADPAFRIPMTSHTAERFAFGVVPVG